MKRYAFFLLLQADFAWLQLARPERAALAAQYFQTNLAAYPQLSARWFDAEAFKGAPSDVLLIECQDPAQYYDFFETLRDTPLLAKPYFRLIDVLTTIEDGYREYEKI